MKDLEKENKDMRALLEKCRSTLVLVRRHGQGTIKAMKEVENVQGDLVRFDNMHPAEEKK